MSAGKPATLFEPVLVNSMFIASATPLSAMVDADHVNG
jgi:hypothetical protein